MGFNGIAYKPKLSTVLPYTVGATPIADSNVEPFSELTLSEADTRYERIFDTLTNAIASTTLKDGDSISLKNRVAGKEGGSLWDVVLLTSVTPSIGEPAIGNVVTSVGVPALALVLRTRSILISSEWGAINDESTDNTAVIQLMIDSTQPTLLRHIFNDDGCFFELSTLVFNNDVQIEYRANDESNAPTEGQVTNERVTYFNSDNAAGSVNEFQIAAALHPGLILDAREDTP